MLVFLSGKFKFLQYNFRKIPSKWHCQSIGRRKSSTKSNTKTYSHTILLPKTNFPSRSKNANTNEIEKTAQFSELYAWQREHAKGPEFVLHDGPPYANGDLHMGHAVNKIIKDICNRSKVLQGNKVHYVPGWDCHGLPIELKALHKVKKGRDKKEPSDPVYTRHIARTFALDTVEKQKAAFKEWGVMADWDNDTYLTLDKSYIKNQLRQFYKMYKKGLIFRTLKPVYWSPSSKTALAEAELEYDPQYKSKEVYVKFRFQTLPDILNDLVNNKTVHALIWTTTPWTLIANRAICFNPQMRYCLVQISGDKDLTIIGSDLVESLQRNLSMEIVKLTEFEGHRLSGCMYENKLTDTVCPLLAGDHVTGSKGTGLVHTAPAHGPEDFLIALKNNMTVDCNVDESGCYTNLDPELNGLYVLKEGQDVVLRRLNEDVIHQGWYTHSYALDWRTKKPVILRASHQWFIDTGALKQRALDALKTVSIMPVASAGQHRLGLRSQLERRPYWCISRQRAWGAPIPVLYNEERPIVDERIIDRLCELVEQRGPDVWWTCDVTQLLTEDVIDDLNLRDKTVTKGKDILDIWLDSGLSWSSVLEGKTAELYVEGVDQFTGWFQSSLLTSVALKDRAPYKSILVHGFVVDENKCKMSKSIGNIIDPMTIIYGGKDKSQPAYGINTLRWWVASHGTQHSQIAISKKLLDESQSEVVRIRNIMKYLLGVIGDLDKHQFNATPKLNYFDRYILKETYEFDRNINKFSDTLRYNQSTQSINFFISNTVSGLYSHCVKDRLYCSAKDSNERVSCQLVMHTILITLSRALGPILPHLVEEAWQYHPLYEKPFFFTENVPMLTETPIDTSTMDLMMKIKKELHANAKHESLKKYVAFVKAGEGIYDNLMELNENTATNESVLCEILEVSSVTLERVPGDEWRLEIRESDKGQCLRCRKYTADNDSDKCDRCQIVLYN